MASMNNGPRKFKNKIVMHSPMLDLRATQAGPGLRCSAAIGPRLLVGVHGLWVNPPILQSRERQHAPPINKTAWHRVIYLSERKEFQHAKFSTRRIYIFTAHKAL
jgi:hypothetical protein